MPIETRARTAATEEQIMAMSVKMNARNKEMDYKMDPKNKEPNEKINKRISLNEKFQWTWKQTKMK